MSESALVQGVDLLFPASSGVITFASVHGTGVRGHVWGGSESMKTRHKAKQVKK